jgi:hypothetical protein
MVSSCFSSRQGWSGKARACKGDEKAAVNRTIATARASVFDRRGSSFYGSFWRLRPACKVERVQAESAAPRTELKCSPDQERAEAFAAAISD